MLFCPGRASKFDQTLLHRDLEVERFGGAAARSHNRRCVLTCGRGISGNFHRLCVTRPESRCGRFADVYRAGRAETRQKDRTAVRHRASQGVCLVLRGEPWEPLMMRGIFFCLCFQRWIFRSDPDRSRVLKLAYGHGAMARGRCWWLCREGGDSARHCIRRTAAIH
jgi:hypothetical protein